MAKQRYNICTLTKYTTKNNEEKKNWNNVGSLLVLDDGRVILSLNMFPETRFYVFEQREREDKQEGTGAPSDYPDSPEQW